MTDKDAMEKAAKISRQLEKDILRCLCAARDASRPACEVQEWHDLHVRVNRLANFLQEEWRNPPRPASSRKPAMSMSSDEVGEFKKGLRECLTPGQIQHLWSATRQAYEEWEGEVYHLSEMRRTLLVHLVKGGRS